MNAITGESIVSCYVDAASLLVMVLLLALSERLRNRHNPSLHIFYRLSLCVAAICVFSFVCHMMYGQTAPWCHTAAVISRTLWEWFAFLIVAMWVDYVNCKLYGPKRRPLLYALLCLPFVVFTVLLIVNLFTGIVFTYTSKNLCDPRLLYYVFEAIEFICFVASAVSVWSYDRKNMNARYLRVSPMILSVTLAVAVQFFLPYQIDVLGFTVGTTLLYFSMINEFRFMDEESGLFNKRYLSSVMDMAISGQRNFRSALIFEVSGDMKAAFEILRNEAHAFGDVIRVENNRFLMFTEQGNLSMIQMWSSVVTEAVEKHNAAHPDAVITIRARGRLRENSEDVFAFINATVENRESGSYFKGLTSMMEELDRLDNELSLAADIQLNMLPMVFPPFPDRTEFDLFASMTPAKEVGGDFYDFFLIDSDHLALVIADVSGKGIPAALFMMVSKTLIKNQLMGGSDPAAALEHVNLQLCERNSSMMFVTVWLAVLEISTGKGMACNAGHENPGLRRAGGGFELLKYRHGMSVAVTKEAKYRNREFELRPGDCVFVYTDGVPEATRADMQMFGGERLSATLNRHADEDPEALIHQVHDAVDRFANGAPQFDDITMLCLKYYGAEGRKAEQ